jgi:hypothetical protein
MSSFRNDRHIIYGNNRRNGQDAQGLVPPSRVKYIRSLEDNSIIVDLADKPLFTIKILLTILSMGVFALALAVIYLLYIRFQDLKNAEEYQESNEGPLGISAINASDMEWLERELDSSVSSKSSSLSSLTKSMKLCKSLEGDNSQTPDTSRLSEYGMDENQLIAKPERTECHLRYVCGANDLDPHEFLNKIDIEAHHSVHRFSNADTITKNQECIFMNNSNRHEEETIPQSFSLERESVRGDNESKDEEGHNDENKNDGTEEERSSRLQEI